MTCEKLRVELPAYLSGELDEATARLLAEHLAHCEACFEEMKAVERLNQRIAAGLRAWVDEGPTPPGLEEELRQAVRMAGSQPVDLAQAASRAEWWRTLATAAAAVAVALLLVSVLPQSQALQGVPVVGALVQILQGTEHEIPLERSVTGGGVTLRVHSVRYTRDETQVLYSLTGVGALDRLETGHLAGTLLAGQQPLPLRQVQVDVPAGRIIVTFGAAPRRVPLVYRLGPLPEVPGGPWEVSLGFRP